MTKSQLQSGMIAVTRNGNEYLVLPNKLLGFTTTGIPLDRYSEDLTMYMANVNDVTSVYTTIAGTIDSIQNPDLRTLIWQRDEYKYPIYCKSIIDSAELVVCFSDRTTGIVIKSDMKKYPIGYTSSHWLSHTAEQLWKQIDAPIKEYEYPLYFINEPSNLIVEFTDLTTGKVIDSGTSQFPLGHTSDKWREHTDEDIWTPLIVQKSAQSNKHTALSLEEICEVLGVTIKEVH